MSSKSNTGITLVDVRTQAMETIQLLKSGQIDRNVANTIKGLLDTVIDTAKTQVEFIKAIPAPIKDAMSECDIKAIAGTLVDRDAELDVTIDVINRRKEIPYQMS